VYVQRLRNQAAHIPGLRMRFYGAYEINELPWLLRDVDCVITSSAWPEAFGIVTREALRRGIPVIVSRVGGLTEAVVEGVNGFAFDPEHPEELGALLLRLTREQDLLPRLRRGAQSTPVLTTAEHALAVRAVYIEAQAEAEHHSFEVDAEAEKIFDALVAAGFAGK
jgi:glycosyltransferase involved in cell wall biosynthesis